MPGITKILNNKFEVLNGVFVNIGSRMAVNKLTHAMQLTATDALAYLIEAYQATQCIDNNMPMPLICHIVFLSSCRTCFMIFGINNIAIDTNKTRYHTKLNSPMLINFPKIAVSPHKNVAICICVYALLRNCMLQK